MNGAFVNSALLFFKQLLAWDVLYISTLYFNFHCFL